MVDSETIKIQVNNKYGDSFKTNLKDPTCSEILSAFVKASRQLGFPLRAIYDALEDSSETIKSEMFGKRF